MARSTLRMRAADDFALRPTVRSHGWSDLPPFGTDATGDTLLVRLGPAAARVRQRGRRLLVDLGRPLATEARAEVRRTLRDVLGMDLDLQEFWELCRDDPDLAWAAEQRAGRMLRAPTVFADAAIMLATTNCSWVRRKWSEAFPRRRATDRAIGRHFARYGRWRGLALWLSLTRPWHERGTWRAGATAAWDREP